jgi:hypothetical protein
LADAPQAVENTLYPPGTPIDFSLAINSTALTLNAGSRYIWRLFIDDGLGRLVRRLHDSDPLIARDHVANRSTTGRCVRCTTLVTQLATSQVGKSAHRLGNAEDYGFVHR